MKAPKLQEKTRTETMTPRQAQVAAAQNRDEHIRQRAYELFQERQRKGAPGSDLSDWLQAEKEVRKN